jgi:hypothetical protein
MDFPTTFTDCLGRAWTVTITVGTLPRLKSVAGIELDDLIPRRVKNDSIGLSSLADFLSDPISILQAVYAVCKPQIDKAGLTFDQFAEGFEGEQAVSACEAMAQAFLQALHDFFLKGSPIPQPLRAAIVKRVTNLGRKLAATEAARGEAVFDRIESKIAGALTPELTAEQTKNLDAEIDGALSKFVGNTPASSESIRAS